MLLPTLIDINNANRMVDLERTIEGSIVRGDFEGSVTGTWVRLDNDGTGVVQYKGKDYKTVVLGIVSIPYGTRVELSHASGIYYSKF